jgi:hypothetical protein
VVVVAAVVVINKFRGKVSLALAAAGAEYCLI